MKRKEFRIMLLLLVPVALVTGVVLRWQLETNAGTERIASTPPDAPNRMPVLDSLLAGRQKGPELAGQLDTTTQLTEKRGWPFTKLPQVAKFARSDSQVEAVVAPIDSIVRYEPRVDSVVPVAQSPTEPIAALLVLPPLALAASVTRADVTAQVVVPEPGTLLLLAVGLAVLVLLVIRRQRSRRATVGVD